MCWLLLLRGDELKNNNPVPIYFAKFVSGNQVVSKFCPFRGVSLVGAMNFGSANEYWKMQLIWWVIFCNQTFLRSWFGNSNLILQTQRHTQKLIQAQMAPAFVAAFQEVWIGPNYKWLVFTFDFLLLCFGISFLRSCVARFLCSGFWLDATHLRTKLPKLGGQKDLKPSPKTSP